MTKNAPHVNVKRIFSDTGKSLESIVLELQKEVVLKEIANKK